MTEKRLIKLLKALGDISRLRIFKAIALADELSCGEIAEQFPIAQATVSHHLKVLVEVRLVEVRKAGQFSFFSVNQSVFDSLAAALSQLENGASS